jgi:ABC-type bacteriocin/lantibiotic exporter with double-glycine peptidase domain
MFRYPLVPWILLSAAATAQVAMGVQRISPQMVRGQAPPHRVDYKDYRACGLTSFYSMCLILGLEVDFNSVRDLLRPAADGANSLAELSEAARAVGLTPVVAELPVEREVLRMVPGPAILHTKRLEGQPRGSHFLVYLGETASGAFSVLDPPYPPETVDWDRLSKLWTGFVLIPARNDTEAQAIKEALRAQTLKWWTDPGLWSAGALGIALAWVGSRGWQVRGSNRKQQ